MSRCDFGSNESIEYIDFTEIELYRNHVHSRYSFDDKSGYFDDKVLISPDSKLDKKDLNKIYQKLNDIHSKLVNEYKTLKVKEETLSEREQKLINLDQIKLKYDKEIESIRDEIKKKTNENKRLSDSFKITKDSNEGLKNKLNEANEKIEKLEKQNQTLKSRLVNLQKKVEFDQKQNVSQEVVSKQDHVQVKKLTQHSSVQLFEPFAISLSWLNETLLKNKLDFSLPLNGDTNLLENIQKILPCLTDLLINSKKLFKEYEKNFLEFIYWSLLHFDFSFQNQKINLSNTFRRMGDELFKNLCAHKLDEGVLNESLDLEDPKIRVLSCLIALRTLNQIDHVIQVFEVLRDDLKDESIKETFLSYHGTWTILKWCKLGNQVVLNLAIDIYLLMSIDWKMLVKFLESCSNESWFSQTSILLRNSNVTNQPFSANTSNNNLDLKMIEKMSILFQKLSKIRSNKKYFEMFSLNKICNDLLKRFGHESDFLKMNLKSILFNLK